MNKKYGHPFLLGLMVFGLGVALSSCKSTPREPVTEDLEIRITAATNVNPDPEQRPSPIVLHMLQLTDIEEFNRAEYFALARNDAAALGGDVLNKTEVVMKPGDYRETELRLSQQTAYIGFVAGYRDIEHAQWRITQRVVPGKTDWISINLDEKQISIIEVND